MRIMSELAFPVCMYVRYALPYPIPNLDLSFLRHDQRTAAYTWHQAPESRPAVQARPGSKHVLIKVM